MDPYDTEQDSLTLQEMIDCDIRTSFEGVLRSAEYSQQVSGLELSNSPLDNFDNMGCDSGGGSMTAWFPGSQQSHFGLDFDSSAGGVLVNPQAVMPQPQQINIQNVNIVCTAASPMFVGHQSVVSPAQTLLGPEISEGLRFSMDGRHPHNNPKAAVDRPKTQANGARDHEKMYPKPAYSYSCLIAMALKNSKTGSLPVSEIYSFMTENFPYFKTAPNGWKNSVRHNLSLNKCFEKIEKPAGNSSQRKGCLWAMNPAKVEKMEEEVQKWSRKDPLAIKRSMANPEKLELLEKGCLRHELALKQESIKQGTKDSKNSDSIYTFKSQIKLEPLDSDLDLLESNLPLDTSLPDLNLQTGIWDELNDHRLNFGTGDSSSASPSSALSAGSPMEIVTPTSLHSNYVYTQSLTLNNNDNNTADNNNSQATLNSNYLGKNCKSVPALI